MIRNNLHTAAETFAKEADISPEPAAVNPPEGFLTEWWSLFWDVYSAKLPNHPEAMPDSLDKNVSSVLQRPDMNCMPPSACPSLPTPRLPDFLQNVYSTIIPRSDIGSMPQIALPTMISRSELNSNGLGLPPMLDTTIGQRQHVTNWISENMSEQERLMLSARDLNFNARLLNVDQLASLPPFSINSRYLQKGVPQKTQRPVFINDRSCTYLGSSSARKAVSHEAFKQKQPKSEPDDAGSSTSSNSATSAPAPASKNLC
ncbi:uncharacterized protein LOC142554995 [Primulina tabacum]|uniref:uncharacterized protein LOC142554995 n=1 Tax=Primulina tabacum TaxID=48773 RepID=UPI003F59A6DD